MKFKSFSWTLLAAALALHGCGGGDLISNAKKDTDALNPAPGTEDLSARPRPSATAVTITTDSTNIYDAQKQPLVARGIDLELGTTPSFARLEGISAIKDTGSNIIRLHITEETTDPQLEAALAKVVEEGLVAIVTLNSPKLACSTNAAALNAAVDSLWLKKWLGVIAQDRFQPHLIINIANAWGPDGIFNPDSYGYRDYLDTYKAMVNKFRAAGFNVPIAIDAPCGQDFNAFARERGRELAVADKANNIILSIQADGNRWNTEARVVTAISNLMEAKAPFLLTSFKGSDVGGLSSIDHLALMDKAAGNPALELSLPWLTDADTAAYVATFDEELPLLDGAGVSTNVYLDARYLEESPISESDGRLVPKGKLTFSMYVKDADGNGLRVGSVEAKDLRGYQWNRVAFTLPKNNDEIEEANLLNGTTSFDLTRVKQIGFELLSNGKNANIKAPIKLDDVEIYPGAPEPTLAVESTFETGGNGWSRPDWSPGKAVFEDGFAKLSLNAGDWGLVLESPGWQSQEVLPHINFKQNVFVNLKVFVPESYNGQSPEFTIEGQFGNWDISAATNASVSGGVKFGEWNHFLATLKWSEAHDVSTPQSISIKLGGVSANAEPLLLDTVTITQQPGKRTKTVTALQYESRFSKDTETFASAWNRKADVEMVDGELHITPKWALVLKEDGTPELDDDGNPVQDVVVLKADINSISDIDVSGPVVYKVRIFIPASYAGSNLEFRIFTQDNNWGNDMDFPGRSLTIDDFTPGEWTSFEFETDDFPAGFARTQKLRHFGFRWDGTDLYDNHDVVKIDDIQFFGNSEVEDSQPLYTNGFDTQEAIDSVELDFAGGAFTESALVGAKKKSWKISPFGWTAFSWFGNTGENAALNISNAEELVDLTARGEEVVNGPKGIKETSHPVSF